MTDLKRRDAVHFYARHMQAGIARYEDEDLLVDNDAGKQMMPTFVGKPIFVNHRKGGVPLGPDDQAGIVSRSFYNDLDGWFWLEGLVWSDEGKKKIEDGWAVSNAFYPTDVKGAGKKHNMPFNREVTNAEYTHLALTPTPRYEAACIFTPEGFKSYQAEQKKRLDELHNSKNEGIGKKMLSFWKTEKKEIPASEIDGETMVELQNGKTVSVAEMMNAVEAAENDAAEKAKAELEKAEKANDMDAEVTVGSLGKMKVSVLSQKYLDLLEFQNAEKEAKEKADKEAAEAKDKEEKEKANALAEAEKVAAAAEKKEFDELANANTKVETPNPVYDMESSKKGASMFGSGS